MKSKEFFKVYKKLLHEKFTKKIFVLYLIALAFLIFFFKKFIGSGVIISIKNVNWWYLIVAGTLYGLSLLVRGYRLNEFVRIIKKTKLGDIVSIQIVSQVISIYTTALAESVKAIPLKYMEDIPIKKSIKIFVIEKSMDLLVNLVVIILSAPFLGVFFPEMSAYLTKFSAVGVALIVIVGGYYIWAKYKGVVTISKAVKVLGSSFGIFLIQSVGIYYTFRAMGISPPYYMIFVIYAILSIVPFLVFIPLGLGVKEPLIVMVTLTSMTIAQGGTFSILINIMMSVPYTVMALVIIGYYIWVSRRRSIHIVKNVKKN